MWFLEKDITISASHRLKNYEGACNRLHGHNFFCTIYCQSSKLNEEGMVIDFKEIKNIVNQYDHQDLNFIIDEDNPTAEILAKRLCSQIPFCYKVLVEEQQGSRCVYVKD